MSEADSGEYIDSDWLLSLFVSMVNDGSGMTIGITLFVGGAVISGQLIGGRDYFTSLSQQFERALGVDRGDRGPIFKGAIDLYSAKVKSPENPDSEDGERTVAPGYLHLRNSRVYHGTTQIPQQCDGILWRGRLTQVDGFILGELRQERKPDTD